MSEPRKPDEPAEGGYGDSGVSAEGGYGGPGVEAELPRDRDRVETVTDPDEGRQGDEEPGAPEDYTEAAGEPP